MIVTVLLRNGLFWDIFEGIRLLNAGRWSIPAFLGGFSLTLQSL
jgi:hypothetical protein